jgi:hypothetical protein
MSRNPFFERMRKRAYLKALDRPELRMPSAPRLAASGPVSAAMKMVDPEIRALIDAAIARRAS